MYSAYVLFLALFNSQSRINSVPPVWIKPQTFNRGEAVQYCAVGKELIMLNNSEIQESWEAEATQMGFFHADVWVGVELYDVLSYDGASSMDGLLSKDDYSDKYAEVYYKMYDNVQERQNLSFPYSWSWLQMLDATLILLHKLIMMRSVTAWTKSNRLSIFCSIFQKAHLLLVCVFFA